MMTLTVHAAFAVTLELFHQDNLVQIDRLKTQPYSARIYSPFLEEQGKCQYSQLHWEFYTSNLILSLWYPVLTVKTVTSGF